MENTTHKSSQATARSGPAPWPVNLSTRSEARDASGTSPYSQLPTWDCPYVKVRIICPTVNGPHPRTQSGGATTANCLELIKATFSPFPQVKLPVRKWPFSRKTQASHPHRLSHSRCEDLVTCFSVTLWQRPTCQLGSTFGPWCFPSLSGRFVKQVSDGRENRKQNTTEVFQAQESLLFTFDLPLHLFSLCIYTFVWLYVCVAHHS